MTYGDLRIGDDPDGDIFYPDDGVRAPALYQPDVPGPPLKGPARSGVIQPP